MGVFCSSLIAYFPDTLLKYCLGDFEMVSVAPIIIIIIIKTWWSGFYWF